MDRQTDAPLAYLITFRCYGTWLHGDARGSSDRHRNAYGSQRIPPNRGWQRTIAPTLTQTPVRLDGARRRAVEAAIRETCEVLEWELLAVNVRTNHAHAVVAAECDADRVLSTLKAYATRAMREAGCWTSERSPWVSGGSRKYLWSTTSVERAIAYVVDGQGGPLFD